MSFKTLYTENMTAGLSALDKEKTVLHTCEMFCLCRCLNDGCLPSSDSFFLCWSVTVIEAGKGWQDELGAVSPADACC